MECPTSTHAGRSLFAQYRPPPAPAPPLPLNNTYGVGVDRHRRRCFLTKKRNKNHRSPLRSPKFADEEWEKTQELLRSVLIELASCAASADDDDDADLAGVAMWHNGPAFDNDGHNNNAFADLEDEALPVPEDPYLPLQHAAALSLVGRLGERARGLRAGEEGAPVDLSSCLKFSTKKNGVAGAATEVGM